MDRSIVFTLHVSEPHTRTIASPDTPGSVQILLADAGAGVENGCHQNLIDYSFSNGRDRLIAKQARADSTDSSDIRSEMIAAGMTNIGDPPSDDELRRYHESFAPAHEAIREGRFSEAASAYRWLAAGANDPHPRARYVTAARQLHIAQQIRTVSHGPVSFPPTGAEVEAYFLGLAGLPINEIQNAFQEYVDAFYVELTAATAKCCDEPAATEQQPEWCTQIPVNWEILQRGKLDHDGRRLLDPVGYALLGQKCLMAAGFSTGQFAVASKRRSSQKSGSLSTFIMFTASRTCRDSCRWSVPHTEVVVVSNGTLQWAVTRESAAIEAVEEVILWSAFQKALGVPMDQAGRVAQERVVRHQELSEATAGHRHDVPSLLADCRDKSAAGRSQKENMRGSIFEIGKNSVLCT
jgi:hypothetical protein